jgi:WD40 repeat protein
MIAATYQIGGSLTNDDPYYVVRQADSELYEGLIAGEFCYVFNCRQMGKSSLLVRTMHRLEGEGYRCAAIDMTNIGTENITPSQWYKGILYDLWLGFNLLSDINFGSGEGQEADFSDIQMMSRFIADLLGGHFPDDRLVIFIDEIDSLFNLDFATDDFFALIRYCYNQRAINPNYRRITFALFGVATPSDLIADKTRTPFNIGRAIELHGFQEREASALAKGLEGKVDQPAVAIKQILKWTDGQPFLTQKLCDLLVKVADKKAAGGEDFAQISLGAEAFWVDLIVRNRVAHKWESQDDPEHLRTIRDRITRNQQRAGRLLGIYQQILEEVPVPADDSRDQIELLLSGLVVKQESVLKVKNLIYREVFNRDWVEKQLNSLRPYSQAFDAWMASKQQDTSRLLRGQALIDAQMWAQGKSLSDWDYQFLGASQELDRREVEIRLEAARTKEVEARLAEEQRRLALEKKSVRRQRVLLLAVSVALLFACALGLAAYFQYRQAAFSEIKALATSSKALYASDQKLDALVEAIRAKQNLQKLGEANAQIREPVEKVLRQAVYGAVESNRLSGHSGPVLGVAFSPDGNLIASGSGDNTVKLWKKDGSLVKTIKIGGSPFKVKFSPDGDRLAAACLDNTVKVWELNSTKLVTFKGHSSVLRDIAFSPDGSIVASASLDGTVKLWRRDGTVLTTLKGDETGVFTVSFSPDGKKIATSNNNKIELWDWDGSQAFPLQTLQGHSLGIWSIAFSPDGKTLASASDDETVKLWELDTLSGFWSHSATLSGHSAAVFQVAFSPDGKILASASGDRTVKLWSLDGILLTALEEHNGGVRDVAFSPDSRVVASAGEDNTVRLWKPEAALLKTFNDHKSTIWSVAFSPQGDLLVSGSADNTVKLWKRDGTLLRTFGNYKTRVTAVTFTPEGNVIVSASADLTVKIWKLDGTLLKSFPIFSSAIAISFSPDGQNIVLGSADSTITFWKPDGTLLGTLKGHTARVFDISFSPDGQLFASGSADGQVKLWKPDGTFLRTLKGHGAAVRGVKFSPDGQLLASASFDGTVKLWKPDGSLLRTLKGDGGGFTRVDFSPDGQVIAASTLDNAVKLWKLDGTSLTTLTGHSNPVWSLAFSPDGKTIASAGDDKTIIVWDVRRILNLDLLDYGCDWVRDYLRTNAQLEESDRKLCDGTGNR